MARRLYVLEGRWMLLQPRQSRAQEGAPHTSERRRGRATFREQLRQGQQAGADRGVLEAA
eukprot:527053-Amphidinium_carterae.1